jgi:hypothetical protein
MSWFGVPAEYWLTRLVFQRALAAIYLNAFVIALNQARPLVGPRGLMPGPAFLARVKFWDAPGVFWLNSSDTALWVVAAAGIALSLLALTGVAESFGAAVHMIVWASLWMLYLSFVSIGQVFWGFGWETLLLETGFLTIFLGAADQPTPVIVIWLLRWVVFRVMFGAGLIKLRGDPCWRDLTCMVYHYETQPLPNPLSWYLHRLPVWMHKAEVLLTHVVELVVPFGMFAPPPIRYIAGAATILFQGTLILSGNLSWLNYITIVLAISCFDDPLLGRFLPLAAPEGLEPSLWFHRIVSGALALVVLILSYRPVINLISPGQLMNASFEPLHLVNTYGAFGSITRVRHEVILEGTDDPDPGPTTVWREYQFKCKPGDVKRRPCVLSPYHYKIDWQMWFAAMSPYYQHPWILSLIGRLLEADGPTLALMEPSPFGTERPRFIRAALYEYHFTESRTDGAWWERRWVDSYLPPLSLDHREFRQALSELGWVE